MRKLVGTIIILCSFNAFSSGVSLDLANDAEFQKAMDIAKEKNKPNDYIRFDFEPLEDGLKLDCEKATPEQTYDAILSLASVKSSPGYKTFETIMKKTLSHEANYTICDGGTMTDGGGIDELYVYGDQSIVIFKMTEVRLFIHY